MTTAEILKKTQIPDDLRFDDHTDLTALGIDAEPHDWRLPANLPAKPKGLALGAAPPAAKWIAQEVSILQYQSDWRIWIVPLCSATLMLCCLGLIGFRLSMSSSMLLMLCSLVLTLLGISVYHLRQPRLVVDQHGLSYGITTEPKSQTQIGWDDLVGITQQRCFAGRTLIAMSRHGVDHSIRIAYLPAQTADQLTRLLRTQLARRGHV